MGAVELLAGMVDVLRRRMSVTEAATTATATD
jgi:hypothetical protein